MRDAVPGSFFASETLRGHLSHAPATISTRVRRTSCRSPPFLPVQCFYPFPRRFPGRLRCRVEAIVYEPTISRLLSPTRCLDRPPSVPALGLLTIPIWIPFGTTKLNISIFRYVLCYKCGPHTPSMLTMPLPWLHNPSFVLQSHHILTSLLESDGVHFKLLLKPIGEVICVLGDTCGALRSVAFSYQLSRETFE